MIRMFQTHEVRRQEELSDCLWNFRTEEENPTEYQAFVPGCWETLPGLGTYRGTAVYTRSFQAKGNIRLEFKGVSHTAEIYLDGKKIAEHYGAYTPFAVIAKNVKNMEHLLEVRVDNCFSEDSSLHIPNDYMTYGGINRPVILELLEDAYIEWAHYTPYQEDDKWMCQAEVCVCGLSENDEELEVKIEYNGQKIKAGCVKLKTGEKSILKTDFCAGTVQEWSPETPKLYLIKASLFREQKEIDDLIERIGFREILVHGNRILLNGRKLRIKGACRHEEYAGFGCALPEEIMQRDIQMIRDMGMNSIRTTHYPNDERFLDLCDEQGILIWEENHARGLVEEDMRNKNFNWQCEICNKEMVTAHYNHPSIYIWGILNECASETEYGRNCYQQQLNQIKGLDGSRPLTFATCRFAHKEDGSDLKIKDICMDLPDVMSYNCYPLWYFDREPKDFLSDLAGKADETPGNGKPLIISEIGAGGEYGFHSAEELKWSEEYQRYALEHQLQGVLENERYSGVYIWQFCDVRVSREWFARRPRSHNNKGIVDEYRRPKLSYETVKRIFKAYKNYFEE